MKKLETRASLREHFQSREFTASLRQKINHVLHGAINKSNKIDNLLWLI